MPVGQGDLDDDRTQEAAQSGAGCAEAARCSFARKHETLKGNMPAMASGLSVLMVSFQGCSIIRARSLRHSDRVEGKILRVL